MYEDKRRPWIDAQLHRQLWESTPEGGVPDLFGVPELSGLATAQTQLRALELTDEELSAGGRIEFEELMVAGHAGGPEVKVLTLRPAGPDAVRPALVYTNCGGKITRRARLLRGLGFVDWVLEHDIVLVVVEMRVGPEHPHPAQVHDSYAALTWAAGNASRLGIDPDRLGLLGLSGGGGVAAATALYARDHGGPALDVLVLLTPMLDDRDLTLSNHFEQVVWPHDANVVGWTAILGDARGGPTVDAYAAPSRADSLAGLPPMYIETGSADTFRDECWDFGMRASEAGIPVELHSWAGYLHGTDTYAPDTELAGAIRAARNSFLRRMVARERVGLVENRPGSRSAPRAGTDSPSGMEPPATIENREPV